MLNCWAGVVSGFHEHMLKPLMLTEQMEMLVKHTASLFFCFYAYFKRISETKMKELLLSLSTSDRTHSKGRKIKRSKSGKRIFATPKVVQQQNKVPSLSCGFQGNVGHKGVSHSYCFQCFFITKQSAFLS